MKLTKLVGLTFVSLLMAGASYAQQPYNGCWHPMDIKNWSPTTDKNAKFNRSRVPLAKRFTEPTEMKANSAQHYGGQICNASILFPTCSLCPSQGANNFVGYQPTYWQYMDKLVYWAGAANEGIINIPPAPSVDAAHQSGVKVLGNIFFPPAAFGGQRIWVQQMLQQENGKYIFAKKLFEIAKYFGFDGWFINEETGGGSTSQWVQFIREFNEYADQEGYTNMEIQWYEAFRSANTAILNTHKNTSQFLDYGRVGDYRNLSSQLHCTPAQTMEKLYGGIETVQQGMTGFGSQLRKVFGKTEHVGSVALFCPEEHIWKDQVKNLLNSPDETGARAHAAMAKVFENEATMWVNRAHNPSVLGDNSGGYSSWPGISGCLLERSSIDKLPFTTSFCVGIGKYRFVKGQKKNQQDWYHSGTQSIMPTWRWWIENGSQLKTNIDWDDAYNFGNSIKVSGTLEAGDHLMRLYKTMIKIDNGGKLRLVYKTSVEGSVEVQLGTQSSVTDGLVTLAGVQRTQSNGWTVDEYDLSQVNTKTVYMIALNLKAASQTANYQLSLGELAMLPASYAPKAMEVSNLHNATVLGDERGDLRLTWDWKDNADFDHFDVYTVTDNGTSKLVGQTKGEGFYVPEFARHGTDAALTVKLVPVMKDGSESNVQTLKVDYPRLTAPVVTVKTDHGYVKKGEIVKLSAKGTGEPTAWKWELPASLKALDATQLTTSAISVQALEEGEQVVTVSATNTVGTSTTKVTVFDVVNDKEYHSVKNVALHKRVESFNGSASESETPTNIIDGVTNPSSIHGKWCNIGANHECVIDLQGSYRIYGFKIFDCKSGPESDSNFDKYRIYLSEDGTNWTKVVDEAGRSRDAIKTDNIIPTKARYVKLNPYSEKGITIRIWEFQVFGVDFSKLTMEVPQQVVLNAGETKTVSVKYNLNGDTRSPQFKCTVSVSRGNLTIGEVKVDNPNADNILKGVKAKLRQYSQDYTPSAPYSPSETDKLTDGNKTAQAFDEIADACKNKQDFWAVFQAPDTWNLSKIRLSIPDNNKGKNENDKEGLVNKNIDIMVSNNGTNWETVYTFEDIKEVSTLECFLPQARKVKYLAVVSTLHPYFYPSLAEVEAFEQTKGATSDVTPLKVTEGWNSDVIVETKTAYDHSNRTLDQQGWVLYTSNGQAKGALCDESGVITSASGIEYQLGDFAQNNALVMKSSFTVYDVTFDEPQSGAELYLLSLCTNGNGGMTVVPIYEDGTMGTSVNTTIPDWYGEGSQAAKSGLSRIKRETGDGFVADEIDSDANFRLFEQKIELDKDKRVKGLKIRNRVSGKASTLLAVSLKADVATGIGQTPAAQQLVIEGIYTIDGIKVAKPVKGVNIFKFADGTTRKVLVK